MDRNLHNAMMAQYATPKVSGDGLVSLDKGVKCVIPSVKLYGAAVQNGTPTPDAPIMPVCNDGVYRSTNQDGTWDGGQATAPELWAIPGTEYKDEWNPQTGWGVRRVGVIDIDGLTDSHKFVGTDKYLSDGYNYAYFIAKRTYSSTGVCSHFKCFPHSATSVKDIGIYFIGVNGSIALLLPDDISGIVSTDTRVEIVNKINAYVASIVEETGQPLRIWYALAKPEPFFHPPARLTQPNGSGQIIQVSGSVPECPIEANYLTHAGGAK